MTAGRDVNPSAPFAIVGIGASAGGLSALEQFFSHVPADSGLAYVVMTHQRAAQPSLLPKLLAGYAKIPVAPATSGERLEPNRVYVAPPGYCLTIREQRIQLEPITAGDGRLPIDTLFRSLAESQQDHAIAIVLSGTGSDGSLGIVEIKRASGMVMAEDPLSAQYAGMPQSAIATKMVDFVLSAARMPSRLQRYVAGRATFVEDSADDSVDPENRGALLKVLSVLRNRTGHDFTSYKKSTIRRRIQRRMNVHSIQRASDYAQFLEQTPYEVDALFRELLISVTSFFRDPDAFNLLEGAIERIVARKTEDQPFRVWIAGCATGEEAYSIAIIVLEQLRKAAKNLRVQLFATDLDPHAIEIARIARYPEGISADVSPERLARFFTREDSSYRINKDVRDTIVFASQNVIKGPPFTKLDLVSCRNLLIYLEPALQRRVLHLFSYALRPHGALFLGTSESTAGYDDRFACLDKRWKLWERRDDGTPELLPDFGGDLPVLATPGRVVARNQRGSAGQLVERALLNAFAPPAVVVSERGEIIYIHGRTGPFLEPAAGEPNHNVFNMAREGLRLELPSAIRHAATQDEPAVRPGLRVKTNGDFSNVRLTVRKLTEVEQLQGTYLLSFELEAPTAASARADEPRRSGADDHLAELENELHRTRENLQGTIEALETSNEELKSTNEELQSTNEELQSANEELETSREEMQSLNEELQAVNFELEQRNRALSQTNDDMQNLLNSTDVATVFLDEKLAIKRFTTQAKKVFSLIDTDIGRPISDLSANLRHDRLLEDAREVLRTLVFCENEIQTKEGAWRLMRIMPYRTHDNVIDGLVLTFIDIDRIKRTELEQMHGRKVAESILDALPNPLLTLDSELLVTGANQAFYSRFRVTPKLVIGEPCHSVLEGKWTQQDAPKCLLAQLKPGAAAMTLHLRGAFSRFGEAAFEVRVSSVGPTAAPTGLVLTFDEKAAPAVSVSKARG